MPENHVAFLVPFFSFLPRSAAAEMRTLTIQNHHLLPDDEYALLEFYCIDPTCDCRRVTLTVLARQAWELDTLAAISLAFDRDGEMAGPFLDPVIVQSPYAEALLEIVAPILESDTVFVAQLESRYREAKQAAGDPDHPVHEKLKGYLAESQQGLNRPRRRRKRK